MSIDSIKSSSRGIRVELYLLDEEIVYAEKGSGLGFGGINLFLLFRLLPYPLTTTDYIQSYLDAPNIFPAAAAIGYNTQTFAVLNIPPQTLNSATYCPLPFGCSALASLASSVRLP